MNSVLMSINDLLWLLTAILCVFVEHPAITIIVCLTTAIYALDLWLKFARMGYKPMPFIKTYWLDIIFLIPICKIFRGFRIIKVGMLLRVIDATCDITEIVFRIRTAWRHRNHGNALRVAPADHIGGTSKGDTT